MSLRMVQNPEPGIKKVQKIIAIAAGKGGVGKSSVTAHLAEGLAKEGYRVGILDIDFYGPSQGVIFPEDRLAAEKNSEILPALSRGIKIVTLAQFRTQASVVRAPIAGKFMQQFLHSVHWGELDFLLVDFPPGTGDIPLSFAQMAKVFAAVLVTSPQEISVIDVVKAGQMFDALGIPILGIVENFSHMEVDGKIVYPFGCGGGKKVSRLLSSPLLCNLPLDPALSLLLDEGKVAFHGGERTAAPYIGLKDAFLKALSALESTHHIQPKRIWQETPESFYVEWEDGSHQEFSIKKLQQSCPCAGCQSASDRNQQQESAILGITTVGRYALKIQFSHGCSRGIYDYTFLRSLGSLQAATQ